MNLVLRVVIAVLVMVSALLTPLAMPSVASASTTPVELFPLTWCESKPVILESPVTSEQHAVCMGSGWIWHAVLIDGTWVRDQSHLGWGEVREQGVEFDPKGTLHVGFAGEFMGNWEGYYVKLPAGGEWTLPVNVSHTSGDTRRVAISVGPDGIVYTAWDDDVPGYRIVYSGNQCDVDLQFFCNRPIPNGRGVDADVLADDQGQWYVWQDVGTPGAGNLVLMQFPSQVTAYIVHQTDLPVDNLHLEPRTLLGEGVRIRWVDADGVEWFCDAWLHPETGEIQLGFVLPYRPYKALLPFVSR